MGIEEKESEDGNILEETNLNPNFSIFFGKTKKSLFSVLGNKILKNKNPRKYFNNVLSDEEFKKLETLVEHTEGRISWEELAEKGVVKVKGKIIEGIYWKGDLYLKNTSVKSLWKFKKIKGTLDCEELEQLTDIGELEEVGGDLLLFGTSVKTLGKLKKVGGHLFCNDIKELEDIGELEEVGGDLLLFGTSVKTLGKLKRVGEDLDCGYIKELEDIGELEEVGGDLWLGRTSIKTLGKLKRVKGNLDCGYIKKLEDLGELKEVGRNLWLKETSIRTLGKLKRVGEDLDCGYIKELEDFGSLEEVGNNLSIVGVNYILQTEIIKKLKIGEIFLTKNQKFGEIEKLDMISRISKTIIYYHIASSGYTTDISEMTILNPGTQKSKGIVIFGGKTEGIEKILEQKEIKGALSLQNLSFFEQMEMLYKIKTGKMKVYGFQVSDGNEKLFAELYQNNILNLEIFREKFGEDINKLEDEGQREYAKKILIRDYERKKIEIKQKIEELANKNRGKSLTEEEKKNLREKVLEFDRELNIYRERIEGFGVKI